MKTSTRRTYHTFAHQVPMYHQKKFSRRLYKGVTRARCLHHDAMTAKWLICKHCWWLCFSISTRASNAITCVVPGITILSTIFPTSISTIGCKGCIRDPEGPRVEDCCSARALSVSFDVVIGRLDSQPSPAMPERGPVGHCGFL